MNQDDGLLVIRRGPGLAQHSTDVAGDGTIIEEVNVLKRTFNVAMEFEAVAADPAPSANLPLGPDGRLRYLFPKESGRMLNACTLYDRTAGEAGRLFQPFPIMNSSF